MNCETSSKDPKNKLILALDVPTPEEATRLMKELRDEVGAFKIGLQLFTAAGASFVRAAVNSGVRIFLDVKFHDIPNTVAKASVEAAKLGVWMFNIHISGGSKMLEAAVREVRGYCEDTACASPLIIGVTVLTSSGQETLEETGISEKLENRVVHLSEIAAKCGLDGVVASPRETPLIKRAVTRRGFMIITPGIRPENATIEDQKRVMTPMEAIRQGSDYLVVGRPILMAKDKIAAVRDIVSQIERADSPDSEQSFQR